MKGSIGIFDSGYGGLTILREILDCLPEYDYIYLGDNARTPYGNRSFETVYKYTSECVERLFDMGCELVIIACNTASAKALRTIQQVDLLADNRRGKRVLGVIRPSVEAIENYSLTSNIGILATRGTVDSESYPIEIEKMYGGSRFRVTQLACPMLVPLIENDEIDNEGTIFFVKKYLNQLFETNKDIDTILLGCTHYPILMPLIKSLVADSVKVVSQGHIVASSLVDYLNRHTEIEVRLNKNAKQRYFTTDSSLNFERMARIFMGRDIVCERI